MNRIYTAPLPDHLTEATSIGGEIWCLDSGVRSLYPLMKTIAHPKSDGPDRGAALPSQVFAKLVLARMLQLANSSLQNHVRNGC